MTGIEKPKDFMGAMRVAREITVVDSRTEFEVYFDVATRLVRAELESVLKDIPVSDEHKKQAIEAEAFSKAQKAHLSDVSAYTPTHLLAMLDSIGVFEPKPEHA